MASHRPPDHGPGPPNFQQRILKIWDRTLHDLADTIPSTPMRASLLEHGTPRASMRILTVILNHIRRILAPRFGQFLWHALADMKLARSSPHHYLEDTAARARLPARGGRAGGARGCLYAYGALFAGGTAEHDFLERFLREKAAPITAQLGLVVEWIAHVVLPTLARGLGGRWALLVGHGAVCGTTAYLVRYSNKYFLALEMSDVFITFGWMALGVTFVGMEALRGHPRGQRAKDK